MPSIFRFNDNQMEQFFDESIITLIKKLQQEYDECLKSGKKSRLRLIEKQLREFSTNLDQQQNFKGYSGELSEPIVINVESPVANDVEDVADVADVADEF